MSADTTTLPALTRRRRAALPRLTLTELTLFLRERAGVVWGVGLPLVLLIIFGNIPGFRKPVSPATPGVSVLDSYVPVLLSFVLAMIALNVLPPVLAG
jgi:ABC-2 type transport system permease protein